MYSNKGPGKKYGETLEPVVLVVTEYQEWVRVVTYCSSRVTLVPVEQSQSFEVTRKSNPKTFGKVVKKQAWLFWVTGKANPNTFSGFIKVQRHKQLSVLSQVIWIWAWLHA